MARASIIAYFYIESKGRRWLLMLSLAAMFPFLLATAFSFDANQPAQRGLVITFLVLFTTVRHPRRNFLKTHTPSCCYLAFFRLVMSGRGLPGFSHTIVPKEREPPRKYASNGFKSKRRPLQAHILCKALAYF